LGFGGSTVAYDPHDSPVVVRCTATVGHANIVSLLVSHVRLIAAPSPARTFETSTHARDKRIHREQRGDGLERGVRRGDRRPLRAQHIVQLSRDRHGQPWMMWQYSVQPPPTSARWSITSQPAGSGPP